jgi:hypothetical protein
MPLPIAIVKVTLLRLRSVNASAFSAAPHPFVLARIGPRVLGRKSIRSGATIAIDEASSPFAHEVAVAGGASIPVRVDVWDERGNQAPARLLSYVGSIAPNWTSAPEVVVRETGGNGELVFRVETTRLPDAAQSASVPRTGTGGTTASTVVVAPTACVEMTAIRGLYQPGAPSPSGQPARVANPVAGYVSEDDKGRIYLDRNLDGTWHRDRQAIEVTVHVHQFAGTLPASAKMKWTVIDPDDPSNDYRLESTTGAPAVDAPPNVLQEWGRYLDPNDYSSPTAESAAQPGDNAGPIRHSPRFEQVTNFDLRVTSAPREAETRIRRGISKITIHCPSNAGDNLIVRAEVTPVPGTTMIAAQTGLMTMWQRIDVEYIRMTGARDLPVADVPPHFLPSCIEMRFLVGRQDLVNPGPSDAMAATEPPFRRLIRPYIDRHFTHRGQGGWFCLLAAKLPYIDVPQARLYPLPAAGDVFGPATAGAATGPAVRGVTVKDYVDVPGLAGNPGVVIIQRPGNSIIAFNTVGSEPSPTLAGATRCWLAPHDIVSGFTAGTGDLDAQTATSEDHYLTDPIASGGYGITGTVQVKVGARGHFPAGTSPTVNVGGSEFFAGRTAIFTLVYPNAAATLDAIVHELTHAFGMPHKCGFWDYKTPRDKSCCMNYGIHGVWNQVATPRNLVPVPSATRGSDHCGRHIKEMRKVRLGQNRGLAW